MYFSISFKSSLICICSLNKYKTASTPTPIAMWRKSAISGVIVLFFRDNIIVAYETHHVHVRMHNEDKRQEGPEKRKKSSGKFRDPFAAMLDRRHRHHRR